METRRTVVLPFWKVPVRTVLASAAYITYSLRLFLMLSRWPLLKLAKKLV